MRIILILSALPIVLTACQDPASSARSASGTPALSSPSGGLLPGETSGCSGDACGLGKDDVDQ